MASANIPSGNVFDNLPNVLIDDILKQLSLIDRIRAAAACQALWRVYDVIYEFRKQLTFQTITINGSTDGGALLCPHNIGKLHMSLDMIGCAGHDDIQIYRELVSFIERIRRDGVQHLSYVQALRIDLCVSSDTAEKCMQQLLRLLPNLTSLYLHRYGGLELLSRLGPQSPPGIGKLVLTLGMGSRSISGLPALLPRLHTLCLTVHETLPENWWHPLLRMSQLRCLSLHLFEEQHNLSGLHHLTTLRHLKLETHKTVDMRSIAGLQQLKSLCLWNVPVSYPEAAAQLKVTSLALQSVKLSQPQTQLLDGEAQQHHSAGPYWPKLTRVQLAGNVSEQLLQAMLLPHPAAAGLNVRISFDTFDDYDSVWTSHVKHIYQDKFKMDLFYEIDTVPILGPEYLAAARATPVDVRSAPLSKSEYSKPTYGFSGQSHADHDVDSGIKTRDKPRSRQAIILLYQSGRRFVSGAAMVLCTILIFVCWLVFWFTIKHLVVTK